MKQNHFHSNIMTFCLPIMALTLMLFTGGPGGCSSTVSGEQDIGADASTDGSDDTGTADAQSTTDAEIDAGSSDTGGYPDAQPGSDAAQDAAIDAGKDASSDSGFDGGKDAGIVPDAGAVTWRDSLHVCWTDPNCHRALVISHGGDWGLSPFLSRSAFEKAVTTGADGIEADVHVTKDGVPMIVHSSPFEFYESVLCSGKKIEEMTADEVSKCLIAPSLTETFQRLDDVLDWANGKLIMELDVKETADLAPTIATILAKGAEDRTTILVGSGEIQTAIPLITGWEKLVYIVDIGSAADIAPNLAIAASHHIFMFEMDRSYGDADETKVEELIKNTVIPGGVKPFCASDSKYITEKQQQDMYTQGFDVILSYSLSNGILAAIQTNKERWYYP